MKIHLLAVGQKMPSWVEQGYKEYAQRLPAEARLELKEIAPGKRGKNADIRRIVQDEGQRIVSSIPKNSHVVVLDVTGRPWSTEQLSERLDVWMQSGQDIALMIGGPEGLSDECRALGREHWSLSALTFPHPLVRIIVAEQLYRAWTILKNHPYHRS
ncbi:MAG: 23S rRNA (pseudouridine(1915)-N(3))-methyltransferase RlmH [Gammaproteobacteria bacterium]|nr:23S rRNA (pseudouridine(1915)-N(3))-methyltransferase RlmH [Gammaproteobacteria bacterium]MCW8910047.1 23S rRNA (pseudouridine(1915)-N(3))-methyltransferase RlmH [Gammaproteobacteria bacterium]MCW9057087.1 23S rRNA (pseudouridine(1915)-N(3))-methyltransferase RlmH [Gammaproteobacteria bacterium]